tara:strand:- start:138 stop:488 length:351 start_codon:yes stop_codon:yes gene_type:complete
MKYSNHEEVFFFGSRSFLNNIDKLGKYEKDGSINTYRGVEDGLSIIIRLGSPAEIQKAKDLTIIKLEEMKTERVNYETSEDRSALSYLDNDRRVKDIALLENFLIRMQDVDNIVEI